MWKRSEHEILDDKWFKLQFDLVNSTSSNVDVNLFNSNTLSTTPETEGSTPRFHITGSTSYNQFLQDIMTHPALVRKICLVVSTSFQYTVPFTVLTRDANGNQVIIPRLPNLSFSANQAQSSVLFIDFKGKELVLDGNTMFSNYTVRNNSTVKMVMWFKQVGRTDFLSDSYSMCNEACDDLCDFKDANYTLDKDIKWITNNAIGLSGENVSEKIMSKEILREQRKIQFVNNNVDEKTK